MGVGVLIRLMAGSHQIPPKYFVVTGEHTCFQANGGLGRRLRGRS
jgi:hypothetical protein